MNIAELKMEMVEIISQTYDEPMVNRIYAKIQEAIEEYDDEQNKELTDESWLEATPTEQIY